MQRISEMRLWEKPLRTDGASVARCVSLCRAVFLPMAKRWSFDLGSRAYRRWEPPWKRPPILCTPLTSQSNRLSNRWKNIFWLLGSQSMCYTCDHRLINRPLWLLCHMRARCECKRLLQIVVCTMCNHSTYQVQTECHIYAEIFVHLGAILGVFWQHRASLRGGFLDILTWWQRSSLCCCTRLHL